MIEKLAVKNLLNQINDHSSKICYLTSEMKMNKEIAEIAANNGCIQDLLVSFHEIFLEE